MKTTMNNTLFGCAVFSGQDINGAGQIVDGADLSAVFGGLDCDLTEAVLAEGCHVKAKALFGGVEIRVPAHVNVVVKSFSLFGGVSNEVTAKAGGTVTVYVSAFCLFGGIDILQ